MAHLVLQCFLNLCLPYQRAERLTGFQAGEGHWSWARAEQQLVPRRMFPVRCRERLGGGSAGWLTRKGAAFMSGRGVWSTTGPAGGGVVAITQHLLAASPFSRP